MSGLPSGHFPTVRTAEFPGPYRIRRCGQRTSRAIGLMPPATGKT